jgi:hypothetical protein
MRRIPPENDIFEFREDDQGGDTPELHLALHVVDDGPSKTHATRECAWRISRRELAVVGDYRTAVSQSRAMHEARFRREIERDLDKKGKRLVRRADGLHEVDAREMRVARQDHV